MKYFVIIMSLVLVVPAFADQEAELAEMTAIRDQLRADVAHMQREHERCRQARRNWEAATWVGAVGTVAAGTGVIIQGRRVRAAGAAQRDAEAAARATR
ncbi:MAG: hypothetical protein FWE64_00360 [Alphaproteobacteria bacterium]|nr:hypothetical protein [Alphaproteobacteria bacterium]